jgi:hypothetical protein
MEAISQQKKASAASKATFQMFFWVEISINFKIQSITKNNSLAMRKIFSLLLALGILFSCNNSKKEDKPQKETGDTTASVNTNNPPPPPVEKSYENVLGSYVGAFGDNKITMLITRATKDSISGRTIVGGNDRPFTGTIERKEDGRNICNAAEPGDHKDDGVFSFVIDNAKSETVSGSWKPNNTKKPAKEYTLERRKFEYSTDVGSWPETSQRLMKPSELENMFKEDLEYMRNEIFARHGYCFKKKNLRQQFEMSDWYVPNTTDIKGFLTDIEKKNIDLIKRYEKYAEEYGDEYGR